MNELKLCPSCNTMKSFEGEKCIRCFTPPSTWVERFRKQFHLYETEDSRDIYVKQSLGELEDFISSELALRDQELLEKLNHVNIRGYFSKENIERAEVLQEMYDTMIKPVLLESLALTDVSEVVRLQTEK